MLKKLFVLGSLLISSMISKIVTAYAVNPFIGIHGNKITLDDIYINNGTKAEGMLLNSRMIQGISDGFNAYPYPDTKKWQPQRNTDEFVANMEVWKSYGLNSFTIGLQGGSPTTNTKSQSQVNTAFNADGSLKPAYMGRLKQILDRSIQLRMIPIVSLFYQSQAAKTLKSSAAVKQGTINVLEWLKVNNYTNVIIEPANECDYVTFKVVGLYCTQNIVDLIKLANSYGFPSGNSLKGGNLPPSSILSASQVILVHGNGLSGSSIVTFIKK